MVEPLLPRPAHPHPPVQDRSRRTLERLLDATEELLAERSFEDLSVREIVGRAGVAIGSFYRRFPEKESLLAALLDRYDRERTAWVQQELLVMESSTTDLEGTVRDVAERICRLFQNRAGLLRALVTHLQRVPGDLTEGFHARLDQLYARLSELMLRHRAEIRPAGIASEEEAVRAAVFVMVTTARTAVVFGGRPFRVPPGLDREQLVEVLTRAALGILQPFSPAS